MLTATTETEAPQSELPILTPSWHTQVFFPFYFVLFFEMETYASHRLQIHYGAKDDRELP